MSEEGLNTRWRVPLEWHEVWIRAITRPSLTTFEEMLADYRASTSRAYTWIYATSLISQLAILVGGWSTARSPYDGLGAYPGADSPMLSLICAPVSAGAAVLGFMISVGIFQWIAGRLGGTGEYENLAIAMASYQAPPAVVSAVLGLLGSWVLCGQWLFIPLGIYSLVLQVMAIKAVNRFSWERAVATILIPVGVLVLVGCLATVVLGVTLGSLFEAGF